MSRIIKFFALPVQKSLVWASSKIEKQHMPWKTLFVLMFLWFLQMDKGILSWGIWTAVLFLYLVAIFDRISSEPSYIPNISEKENDVVSLICGMKRRDTYLTIFVIILFVYTPRLWNHFVLEWIFILSSFFFITALSIILAHPESKVVKN